MLCKTEESEGKSHKENFKQEYSTKAKPQKLLNQRKMPKVF